MTISFCITRHGASAASRSVPARPTFRQSARQSATASRGRGCSGAGIRTAVRSGSRPYPALQSPEATIRRTTIRALRDNTAGTRVCTTLFALRKRFNLIFCKDSASNQHMQINLHVLITESLKSLRTLKTLGSGGGRRGAAGKRSGEGCERAGNDACLSPTTSDCSCGGRSRGGSSWRN